MAGSSGSLSFLVGSAFWLAQGTGIYRPRVLGSTAPGGWDLPTQGAGIREFHNTPNSHSINNRQEPWKISQEPNPQESHSNPNNHSNNNLHKERTLENPTTNPTTTATITYKNLREPHNKPLLASYSSGPCGLVAIGGALLQFVLHLSFFQCFPRLVQCTRPRGFWLAQLSGWLSFLTASAF